MEVIRWNIDTAMNSCYNSQRSISQKYWPEIMHPRTWNLPIKHTYHYLATYCKAKLHGESNTCM